MDLEFAGALVGAAPVGLLVVDEVGTITFASESVEDLTGYGYGDVVGTNILSYLHETAVEGLLESVSYIQAYRDRVMGPVSLGFLHKDGEIRVLEAYATNHYDDPLLHGLVVAVRDITTQYSLNAALSSYTEGEPLKDVLRLICVALLGLPIHGRAAIVDVESGKPIAQLPLPEPLLGPAPTGAPPRPWQVAAANGEAAFPAGLDGFDEAFREAAREAGFATVWAVPVLPPAVATDAAPLAVLVIGRVEGGDPSVNEQRTALSVARSAALILEHARLVGQLNASARTDALTGLANRAHLLRDRSVADARSGEEPRGVASAVLFVDLDGFKPVNDSLGHAAGDAVLREVARRLEHVCRHDDELGRMGGDEFVMLCWGIDTTEEAAGLAARILDALAAPIEVPLGNGRAATVEVGASIGIAFTDPDADLDPVAALDLTLTRADEALYGAKRAGRGRWDFAP